MLHVDNKVSECVQYVRSGRYDLLSNGNEIYLLNERTRNMEKIQVKKQKLDNCEERGKLLFVPLED